MRITPYRRRTVNHDFAGHSPEVVSVVVTNSEEKELLTVILSRLDKIEAVLNPSSTHSPHLTTKEAAAYLRISYSTFRKKATKIRRQPGTGRYRVEDLDEFAASLRSRKKR
jgi:hypothetical protein